MELKYHDQLSSIENCPVDNLKGDKILYRCVENPMTENSFIPNAVLLKPKFQNNCLAWGISLFNNYESAKQILNNLSMNKKINYSQIAKCTITDSDGIKHNSKNKIHFTFYPEKNLDFLSKFIVVDEK